MTSNFVSLPRAAALSVTITVLASSMAAAQTPVSTPPAVATAQTLPGTPEFARLVQGRNVVVTTSAGDERDGVFTVAPTGLITIGRKPGILVPFDQIVKVEKVSRRLRNGTLIGLAAGAGVGLALAVADGGNLAFLAPLLAGGAGAGAGAIVGGSVNAVKRPTDVIYDAKRRTKTTALAPILSPTRKGLAFSMTWR